MRLSIDIIKQDPSDCIVIPVSCLGLCRACRWRLGKLPDWDSLKTEPVYYSKQRTEENCIVGINLAVKVAYKNCLDAIFFANAFC